MRISYFMIVSILVMAEGQAEAQVSPSVDLHIIEPHVFRDWKAALGRPVPPRMRDLRPQKRSYSSAREPC